MERDFEFIDRAGKYDTRFLCDESLYELQEVFGCEEVLEEIFRALSTDELVQIVLHLSRQFDYTDGNIEELKFQLKEC